VIDVTDNGNGMNRDDFVSKWMRIGSVHKRKVRASPHFKRTLTGSKGIGRLSAQFLGADIEIRSIPRSGPGRSVRATIDWNETYKKASLIRAGARVSNEKATNVLSHGFKHGTSLIIRKLKDEWSSKMFRDLARDLWFLQPPAQLAGELPTKSTFKIEMVGVGESGISSFAETSTAALENWIAQISGKVEGGRGGDKARIKVKFRDGETYSATIPLEHDCLDRARFKIFIFKLSGRQPSGISLGDAREYFKKYGGVHLYDNGFHLPYYGSDEQDWLKLEADHSHRLIKSALVPDNLRDPSASLRDLPTKGRIFGAVHISTTREQKTARSDTPTNELLTVQVTRDRLIHNKAYEDLVRLVRWSFDFYSYKSTSRRQVAAIKELAASAAPTDDPIELISQHIDELHDHVASELLEPLEMAVDALATIEASRRKTSNAEKVLLSALATAGMGAVALQHELAKELAALAGVISDLKKNGVADEIIAPLRQWLNIASQTRKMFSPLFDSDDRERMKRIRAKRAIERLANNLEPLLRDVKVETSQISDKLRLPTGTLAGWNAVFQNVLVNSSNAMLNTRKKRIRCRAKKSVKGKVRLIIEDTGVGIQLRDAERLFEAFERNIDLPKNRQALGLGGMGIGLTIARLVCETFGCTARFVQPSPPFKTAFEISWQDT